MTAEAQETRDFLAAHPPFHLLPDDARRELVQALQTRQFAKGTLVMKPGEDVAWLYIVRKGGFETKDPEGQLLARLSAGECFGVRALLRGGRAVNSCEAIEDSAAYLMPAALFDDLRQRYASFSYFFAAFDGGRLGDAMNAGPTKELGQLSRRVADLLTREPVLIEASATLQAAARRMADERVSSILLTDENQALAGILTDKDLRRALAEATPGDTPVHRVMTPSPHCIQAGDYALDAMLTMSRHNIHHLPVLDGGKLAGCLSTSSMLNAQTNSPLFMARRIHGGDSATELRAVVRNVPTLVEDLVAQGANAREIGHLVTTLTDAVTVRLLKLAEQRLGPPPVPYAWMAAGSQARHEQTAVSDQDNCLLMHDDYDEAAHGPYFAALARFVCDGLNECGYVYCPGEMMAVTDKWRKPLSAWRRYFSGWIEEPEPKALMLSSIFFDLRPVGGNLSLFGDLHAWVLEKCRKNRIFLAHMASNALSHRPPIGFFRNLVLISGGEHDHTMDLKHNGIVPIIDLARVYALSVGVAAVNTFERLEASQEGKAVSRDGAADLRDALDFISMVRLRHQAKRIHEGKPADNFVPPDELSSLERAHLKSAFTLVKTMQASLASTYQVGRF